MIPEIFPPDNQILIIAGEVSGDLHAAGLLREFKLLQPGVRFFGVGGERMKNEECELIYNVDEVAFLGLVEVVSHLPFIRKMMKRLLAECAERKPKAVVLVDYPGFNLRFAEKLRRIPGLEKTPILYYISPQVWAWHSSRIKKIARLVTRMAVIFDFEVPPYEAVGLQTDFVGHPLLEVTKPALKRQEFLERIGANSDQVILALLPGSRIQEVSRLLPVFLKTFDLLKRKIPHLTAVVGCSPALDEELYREFIAREKLTEQVALFRNRTVDLQAHCDLALVASGTATLETAILGTPMVMAYRVAPLTYWIGRMLVKIPDIALVNVVAGKRIVPEFVQGAATPERLAAELTDLLQNTERRREMTANLAEVRKRLGEPGASKKVAAILQEVIENRGENAA